VADDPQTAPRDALKVTAQSSVVTLPPNS
jgi:hypothetical protein